MGQFALCAWVDCFDTNPPAFIIERMLKTTIEPLFIGLQFFGHILLRGKGTFITRTLVPFKLKGDVPRDDSQQRFLA